jgi:hypothetical protein
MSITDIRKGDVVTWNGRTCMVVANPIHLTDMSRIMGEPAHWIQWIEHKGETDLRNKLLSGETLTGRASVEIIERGVEMLLPGDPAPVAETELAAAAQRKVAYADIAEGSDEQFREAVRAALAANVPVKRITALTGLSRARVYQIRDGRR